jgi:hypothetical protein
MASTTGAASAFALISALEACGLLVLLWMLVTARNVI